MLVVVGVGVGVLRVFKKLLGRGVDGRALGRTRGVHFKKSLSELVVVAGGKQFERQSGHCWLWHEVWF